MRVSAYQDQITAATIQPHVTKDIVTGCPLGIMVSQKNAVVRSLAAAEITVLDTTVLSAEHPRVRRVIPSRKMDLEALYNNVGAVGQIDTSFPRRVFRQIYLIAFPGFINDRLRSRAGMIRGYTLGIAASVDIDRVSGPEIGVRFVQSSPGLGNGAGIGVCRVSMVHVNVIFLGMNQGRHEDHQ